MIHAYTISCIWKAKIPDQKKWRLQEVVVDQTELNQSEISKTREYISVHRETCSLIAEEPTRPHVQPVECDLAVLRECGYNDMIRAGLLSALEAVFDKPCSNETKVRTSLWMWWPSASFGKQK